MTSASSAFCHWLEQYERTGDLGFVRLGVTRKEVHDWFGKPDDVAQGFRRQPEMGIWRYGIVEFHFSETGELWLVCSEQSGHVPRTILSEAAA